MHIEEDRIMIQCPFLKCNREFKCTGGARNHLQIEHDVPCNRHNVWIKLEVLGAEVPDSMKFWEIESKAGELKF